MKKILSCLLTSVLFLSLIPGSLAQSAPLMAPQGEAQGYLAKKEGIQGVFDALSSRLNKPVVLSKLAARKQVSGHFDFTAPQQVLAQLATQLGLIWYHDGQSIYVYDASEIRNTMISLHTSSFSAVKNFLVQAQLYDKRYPLRGDENSTTFYVSGPPVYIELITRTAKFLDNQNESVDNREKVAVIKLHNTFVDDRQYDYRGQTIRLPGMAKIIQNLLANQQQPQQVEILPQEKSASGQYAPAMPAFSEQRPAALPYKAPMGLAESLQMRQSTPVATPSVAVRKVRSDIALQVVANPSTNSLLVKGRAEHIAFVKQLIAQLDQPKRHIELSVWIIDLEKTALDQLGVNFNGRININGKFGASFNGGGASTLDGSRFIASIMALSQQNKANIVSRPIVLTQENIPAIFDNNRAFYSEVKGDRVATLESVTYGTSVSVLPRFAEQSQIEMMLNIEDGNEIAQSDNEIKTSLPKVGRTKISTVARVPKGKSLLIGGYTRDSSNNTEAKIPGLGSLPWVGGLFRYRQGASANTVRVFLIQPREIEGPLSRDASDIAGEMVKDLNAEPLQDWMRNYMDSQKWT